MYCNGWRSDTCANCVFIFGADGCTHICALNSPDALHDSSQYFYGNVCEKFYAYLKQSPIQLILEVILLTLCDGNTSSLPY